MPPLHVYCLCAAWCDTCTSFRSAFDDVAAQRGAIDFEWIDIEDDSDLFDDIDIDIVTFPTILLVAGGRAIFCAPIRPQRESLESLLALPAPQAAPPPPLAAPLQALAQRLGQRQRCR